LIYLKTYSKKDPAIFSWKNDIQILEQGPFIFKVTEAPLPVTKGVEIAIKELLSE